MSKLEIYRVQSTDNSEVPQYILYSAITSFPIH